MKHTTPAAAASAATLPRAYIERLRADNTAEFAEEAWLDIASSAVYVVIFFVVLLITALAVNLLLEATPAGLPTLAFIDNLFARVSFAVVPVSVRHSELWDIPLPFTLLAHSAAYKNPLVVASVGSWMRNVSGTPTDRHPESQPPTATPSHQPDPDETPR